jgi:hypothetical protein
LLKSGPRHKGARGGGRIREDARSRRFAPSLRQAPDFLFGLAVTH